MGKQFSSTSVCRSSWYLRWTFQKILTSLISAKHKISKTLLKIIVQNIGIAVRFLQLVDFLLTFLSWCVNQQSFMLFWLWYSTYSRTIKPIIPREKEKLQYKGAISQIIFLPRSSHLENLAKILKVLEDSSKIAKNFKILPVFSKRTTISSYGSKLLENILRNV